MVFVMDFMHKIPQCSRVFNGIQRDMCQGFSTLNSGITNLGYQMQNCCCDTNRNIDAVRYEAAKKTCGNRE
jgi:hypothetical protein